MIDLTPDEISILGRPNFLCANIAKVLIEGGLYTKGPQKAEYEQAVFIHWAMSLHSEFGDKWKDAAAGILQKIDDTKD